MLVALGDISSQQASPTQETLKSLKHFLDYAASFPNAIIRYKASHMHLQVHSDASYLSAPQERSREGGAMFLSASPAEHNGLIHCESTILRNVMTSAAEVEIAAIFHNAKVSIPLQRTLLELKHPQKPIPIQTNNYTAEGFANQSIKAKRSKAREKEASNKDKQAKSKGSDEEAKKKCKKKR